MSGYAVSGFVDGFFKGRDWRDQKEDRKKDRARQERLDKIVSERHDIYKTDHAQQSKIRANNDRRAEGVYSRETREDDYRVNRRQEEQDFFKGVAADLKGVAAEMGAAPDAPAMRDQYPVGETPGQPQPAPVGTPVPPQPKLGYGVAPDPRGDVMAGQGQDDTVAGGLSLSPVRGEDQLNDTRDGSFGVRDVDPKSSAFRQDVDSVQRDREIMSGLSRITTKMATEGANPLARGFGAVKGYFSPADDAAEAKAQREAAAEAQKFYQSDQAKAYFSANPQDLELAAQDPVGFFQQGMSEGAPDGQGQPASVPGSATDTVEGPAKAAEVTAAQPVQQEAAKISAEAALDTAHDAQVSLGLPPGQNMTSKQMDRGSQAYVDRYYETVAPKMVEFYIGRGEVEKAQAYIELIESKTGKDALKDIGKATFSVTTGDYDGAANHMLDAFKRYGYVDPTMDVDEEATGIIKDKNGKPSGGKVVFVDRENGNRFEKTFATPDEFIQYGHLMTSPATVAELLLKRKPDPKGAITQQDVMKGATEIMKADISGQMTMQQAIQQYMQGLGQLGVSMGGGGPQQEAPLYRIGQ